jgi:hypothetical protein
MSNSIVDQFLRSIHSVFFISAVMMIISIIPSVIKWNEKMY